MVEFILNVALPSFCLYNLDFLVLHWFFKVINFFNSYNCTFCSFLKFKYGYLGSLICCQFILRIFNHKTFNLNGVKTAEAVTRIKQSPFACGHFITSRWKIIYNCSPKRGHPSNAVSSHRILIQNCTVDKH